MDNNKKKLSVQMEYDEAQTIPLALHEMHMARADRRLLHTHICWAVALGVTCLTLIITVIAFVWLWNQYDYESSTELSGVYCLVDSQGNVVSSDLEPEDVIRILEELNHGDSKEDQAP